MNSENERIEYKREFVDDIAKEVIAFANTDGGEIYVGVNDDGTAAPLANTDDTYTRITNCVRDSVAPDVTMIPLMTELSRLMFPRAVQNRII